MVTSNQDVIDELRAPTRALRLASGPAWRAFGELHEAAARRGATEREVVEALDVALLMGGGPVSVYAPRAYAAFCEFSAACDGGARRSTDGGRE